MLVTWVNSGKGDIPFIFICLTFFNILSLYSLVNKILFYLSYMYYVAMVFINKANYNNRPLPTAKILALYPIFLLQLKDFMFIIYTHVLTIFHFHDQVVSVLEI